MRGEEGLRGFGVVGQGGIEESFVLAGDVAVQLLVPVADQAR